MNSSVAYPVSKMQMILKDKCNFQGARKVHSPVRVSVSSALGFPTTPQSSKLTHFTKFSQFQKSQ